MELPVPKENSSVSKNPTVEYVSPIVGSILIDCAYYTREHAKQLAYGLSLFKAKVELPEPEIPADIGTWAIGNIIFKTGAVLIGVLITGKELPSTVGWGISTVAMSIAYPFAWFFRNGQYYYNKWFVNPERLREHLTQLFVDRMQTTLDEIAPDNRDYFIDHPEQLVKNTVIAVAFLSRCEEFGLKVGSSLLLMQHIEKLPALCQYYFRVICAIKEEISHLNLEVNDYRAWKQLQTLLNRAEFNEETEWSQVSMKRATKDPQFDHIARIIAMSTQLGYQATTDDVFLRLWKGENKM